MNSTFLIFTAIAYLLGSISTAIIVSKLFKLPDPRTSGSHNPGATNVLRISGKKYGVLVLLGDGFKGTFAIYLAWLFGIGNMALGFIGLAAFLGHLYPIFFGFKGGKGVATLTGCLFALSFPLFFIATLTWLLMTKYFHYSSLAALTAATLTPLVTLFIQPSYFLPITIMCGLLIWKHRDNIAKLQAGTEEKIK